MSTIEKDAAILFLRRYAITCFISENEFRYEIFEIIRRVSLTGGLVLVPEKYMNLRFFVAIILSFSSVIIHESTRPYQDLQTNVIALFSHISIFLLFFLALCIHLKILPSSFLLTCALVVVLLVPLMIFSLIQWRVEEERLNRRLQEIERDVQKEELRTQVRQLLGNTEKLVEKAGDSNSSSDQSSRVDYHRSLSAFVESPNSPVPSNLIRRDTLGAIKGALPKFDEKGSCMYLTLYRIGSIKCIYLLQ